MPVRISKLPSGRYRVSTPHGVHAKHTSLAKAKAQERIINAAEHGNWQPTGKKARKRSRQESLELAEQICDTLLARE